MMQFKSIDCIAVMEFMRHRTMLYKYGWRNFYSVFIIILF